MKKNQKPLLLSKLVEQSLSSLSPIQTIMKMAEPHHIRQLGLDPKRMISFGGGWCNHYAPQQLQEIYFEIVKNKEWFHESGRYSSIVGSYHCREQLCRFEQEIYNLRGLTPSNILLGHSSTQLFHDVLRVLCDPGDGVCVLDPTYANYLNAVRCALPGSEIHFVPALDPETWTYLSEPDVSLEVLKKYCSDGAKVFVIPVPDNPTSQIPSNDFLSAASEIMNDYHGFLVLDHAYKALWFDEMPNCYSWSPIKKPNLVTIHSNSKWLSSLGRRFGWVEADEKIIAGCEKINESLLLSPDTLHSMATARFLEETLDDKTLKMSIDATRNLYKKTAQVMLSALDRHLGWKYLVPDGGLYTCCPTPHAENPTRFVERVLKNTGVLLIPGSGFGPSMEYAVRLSYGPLCYDHALIDEGLMRIQKYLNEVQDTFFQ
ncbi:MAG: pyridoxal phosphate-dependent aminotransferase [Candidatus Thermoplasmatota archaeon]